MNSTNHFFAFEHPYSWKIPNSPKSRNDASLLLSGNTGPSHPPTNKPNAQKHGPGATDISYLGLVSTCSAPQLRAERKGKKPAPSSWTSQTERDTSHRDIHGGVKLYLSNSRALTARAIRTSASPFAVLSRAVCKNISELSQHGLPKGHSVFGKAAVTPVLPLPSQ